MAPKKNKSTPPAATNRVTRSSKRQRTPPTNLAAAQAKAKPNSRTLRSSKPRAAALPRVDQTQRRNNSSPPVASNRAASPEMESIPSEQYYEPSTRPTSPEEESDDQLESPEEESSSEAVSKNVLPAAESAAILERYNRNIRQDQERKSENDLAILSGAMENLHDPYLKRVIEYLFVDYKEKVQQTKILRRAANAEPLIPRNLNPSPVQYDRQARDFVRCFRVANAIAEERPNVPQAIIRGSSVVSELTDDQLTVETRKPLKAFLALHKLQECEEEMAYTIKLPNGKTRTGKRRVRGICRHCKKKTKWYCPTCISENGAKRAWYCHERSGSQCQQAHLQKCEDFFHKA